MKMALNQSMQKGVAQMKNGKWPKSDERSTYKARLKYDEYTPLSASRGRILNEIINVVLKDADHGVHKLLRIVIFGKD